MVPLGVSSVVQAWDTAPEHSFGLVYRFGKVLDLVIVLDSRFTQVYNVFLLWVLKLCILYFRSVCSFLGVQTFNEDMDFTEAIKSLFHLTW